MASSLLSRLIWRQRPTKLATTGSVRLLAMSSPRGVKEIKVEEDGTKVVIQGVYKESDRTQSLVEPSIQHCDVKEECHPLCRFDQIHNIKHTDVLILDQFVDSKGHMIPREITGMCKRQHFRMNKLIGMAQKAGIMGLKDKFMHEKVSKPWAKFNTYWDEKTIDIQWHNHEKKKNKWKFQK